MVELERTIIPSLSDDISLGRVSTINIWRTYSEQIYKPSKQKPLHIMFLIKKRRSADTKYLTLWLEVTVQNPIPMFWTVTFLTYRSACWEFCFRTVTSETILRKSNRPVLENINMVYLLVACANILVVIFLYK